MEVYFFVGIAVALLVPNGLVNARPAYEEVAKSVDALVPGIGYLANVFPFPHAMRFFVTVM